MVWLGIVVGAFIGFATLGFSGAIAGGFVGWLLAWVVRSNAQRRSPITPGAAEAVREAEGAASASAATGMAQEFRAPVSGAAGTPPVTSGGGDRLLALEQRVRAIEARLGMRAADVDIEKAIAALEPAAGAGARGTPSPMVDDGRVPGDAIAAAAPTPLPVPDSAEASAGSVARRFRPRCRRHDPTGACGSGRDDGRACRGPGPRARGYAIRNESRVAAQRAVGVVHRRQRADAHRRRGALLRRRVAAQGFCAVPDGADRSAPAGGGPRGRGARRRRRIPRALAAGLRCVARRRRYGHPLSHDLRRVSPVRRAIGLAAHSRCWSVSRR